MKRFYIAIVILFSMILFACGNDGVSGGNGEDDPNSTSTDPIVKTFSGKIEKGALQQGATITASEWSVSGGYSGKVYTTETINNLGGYTLSSSDLQGILDVRADGFFINENTGTVENTRIILSGLVDSSVSGEGNINIITHIIKQRVINLMNSGKTFSEANSQATTELYATLNWTPENPLNTSISQNAKLLFLSSAICKNRSVSQVSDLLTSLVADMADGNIDISVLDSSFALIDTDDVNTNLVALYGTCPDIASVKTQVIAYRNIEDDTVRQITMIPVANAEFYAYYNGSLKGLVSSEFISLYISYVQKYLGETTTINCTINDFFSITNGGTKTIYMQVTFPYDSSTKLYSQTAGIMTEISSLPNKPTFSMQSYEDSDFRIWLENNDTCSITEALATGTTLTAGFVYQYYISDHYIRSGIDYGKGIFLVWGDGSGTMTRLNWLSASTAGQFFDNLQNGNLSMW